MLLSAKASQAQNQGFLEERAHWEEERQVWELTKRTLTEGSWAMNVVNGDPDHPQNHAHRPSQRQTLRPPPHDEGRNQESRVGHRIDWLGPVGRTCPLAIGVDGIEDGCHLFVSPRW